MPWSRNFRGDGGDAIGRRVACNRIAVFVAIPLLFSLLLSAAGEKRVSIYSTAANYSLTVSDQNGHDYVGLLELLEPLGSVNVTSTRASRWKLRYNSVEGEFTAGKTRARVGGRDFDLPENFLLENGRGLVPLSSLSTLLPRFLGGPVSFHEASRRLFVGSVAVHFTAQVSRTTPSSLVMDFTSPVNPMIATEPGKLRMVFTHEPLVPPGAQTLTFDSKVIPSAVYDESNGAAELVVNGNVPLMASFSNDGRTITIAAVSQAVPPAPATPPAVASGVPLPPAQTLSASVAPVTKPSAPARYVAIVDASHGGDERGAALSDQLAEKDVTLAFARRLRQELETLGLTALVLRDGESGLSLDQRAIMVNKERPAIYISVHADSQGYGVRLYTAMVPAAGENRGPFVDWSSAQSGSRAASQAAAASMAAELQKRQIQARALTAPLRPLNNITSPAIALEVAPPAAGISALNSPAYQQAVAESVAAGVAAVRDQLEAGR